MSLFRSLLIFFTSVLPLHADVALPALFSDHAVLQKSARVPIWGTADPGEEISISVGTAQAKAVTDSTGRWRTSLDLSHSDPGPFTLEVTGKNHLKFIDILIGSVWVTSGQSNMGW